MDTEQWIRARRLFETLLALPPAQRAAQLDAACAGDDALKAAVMRLLEAADDLPATREDPFVAAIDNSLENLSVAPAPGRRFGPFAIIEEIGRGGMGAVYLAERRDGAVEQRVALKIVAHAAHDAGGRACASANASRTVRAELRATSGKLDAIVGVRFL